MNIYSNVLEYEYEMDVSNSDIHSDIYSIWMFFIDNLPLQNHVKTKVLAYNKSDRDGSS
jgi:hypothetical protein